MKKKSFMIIGLVAMMLLVAGCDDNGDSTQRRDNPYIGGTDSLRITFDSSNPPSEVFVGDDFFIGLDIENLGEYDVPQGEFEIMIDGINPETYGVGRSDLVKNPGMDLMGAEMDSQGTVFDGDSDYIEFGPLSYGSDLSNPLRDVTLQAIACYSYGTEADTSICIKEDILTDDPSDVCIVNEEKRIFNSAGPVQVTSFTQSRRGSDTISFDFRVEHMGPGRVYGRGGSCDEDVEDEVYVSVDAPAGTDCSSLGGGTQGTLTRIEGSGRLVRCTLDVSDAESSFREPIGIDLEYTYRVVPSTRIDVLPVD